MTKLNEQILSMIKSSEGHVTAEQAFLMARNKGINVSIASIYRILSKLADEHCISKIQIPGQSDVFDKTVHPHGHLKCSVCGIIKDFDSESFEESFKKVTGLKEIFGYSLCIDYICDECRKNVDFEKSQEERRKK